VYVFFIFKNIHNILTILVTHFFTILLLHSLDCFISRTLYRCYVPFCQSSLNEYDDDDDDDDLA